MAAPVSLSAVWRTAAAGDRRLVPIGERCVACVVGLPCSALPGPCWSVRCAPLASAVVLLAMSAIMVRVRDIGPGRAPARRGWACLVAGTRVRSPPASPCLGSLQPPWPVAAPPAFCLSVVSLCFWPSSSRPICRVCAACGRGTRSASRCPGHTLTLVPRVGGRNGGDKAGAKVGCRWGQYFPLRTHRFFRGFGVRDVPSQTGGGV